MQKSFNENLQLPSCVQCKKFFGNPETANMCSVCYKKNQLQENKETTKSVPATIQPTLQIQEETKIDIKEKEVVKSDPTRCKECSRKVGYTGIKCRCGEMFCTKHRFSEDHNCQFNYQEMQKEKLAKENKVIKQKLERFN